MGLKLGPQLLRQGSKGLSEGGGVLPLSVWPWEQAMLSALLSLSPGAQPQRGALPSLPQSPIGTAGQPWPPGAGVESGGSVGSRA